MKLLIAVTTCQSRTFQADAQRATWAKGQEDVRFFVGGQGLPNRRDEIILDADDTYLGLPDKVRATMRWALANGYDGVLKVDDDTYVVPRRLGRLSLDRYDYIGNFRAPTGGRRAPYASGFAYFLSKKAMQAVAEEPAIDDVNEDRWVGNLLAGDEFTKYDEKRFACLYPCGIDNPRFLWGSAVGRTCIAIAQYPADKFAGLDQWYRIVNVSF